MDIQNPSAGAQAHSVRHYFSRCYPQRNSWFGRISCRRGEESTLVLLRTLLPDLQAKTLLDAGCGDGYLLYQLLDRRPRLLQLVDIVPENLAKATMLLRNSADEVRSCAADLLSEPVRGEFDVTLALGLTDYCFDWQRLVQNLYSVTRKRLIVDFPIRGLLHHRLRRPWLALHGIQVQCMRKEDIVQTFHTLDAHMRLYRSRYNWLAVVDIEPCLYP